MRISGQPPVPVRPALATGAAALLGLLAGLGPVVGPDPRALAAGGACGTVALLLVARGVAAGGVGGLGPADLVTLARVILSCTLAALATDAYLRGAAPTTLVVSLAAVALALDAVDGQVARRSGTASAFGARFDGEADAFLLLVLSLYVARSAGSWVLAIGLARYLFGAAGWLLPWAAAPLPFRYWRKVVTAVQGLVLCTVATGALPRGPRDAALLVALVLLAESFGRDIVWLWRRRAGAPALFAGAAPSGPAAP